MSMDARTCWQPGSAEPPVELDPSFSFGWNTLRALERMAEWMHRAPEMIPAHAIGRRGEDLTYWSLRRRGYMIVARNFRLPGQEGELDLVAMEGTPPRLAFVEVKTRDREGRFAAEDAVNAEKRRHMIRLARAYRRRCGYSGPFRYDVVSVYGPFDERPRLTLYRNAFVEEH